MLGGYLQATGSSDFLKQAEQAVPWVKFGLRAAAVGFFLSFCGRRWWRLAAASSSFVLFAWWLLIAESLF